jgi:hypothetical protein
MVDVAPTSVMAYLRARGWQQRPSYTERATIWTLADEEDQDAYEILLPLSKDVRDFRLRMAEVLRTLEVAEQRPAAQIIDDLQAATADVVRIRLHTPGLGGGALPLEVGARLFPQARELLLAAACGAIEPRAVYRARRPRAANEYLQRVQLGQTESGSYVIKLYSPVPMALSGNDEVDEPFERQLTRTLYRALSACRRAAADAAAHGTLEAFDHAVEQGASANLCAAVAAMGADWPVAAVDFGVSWSTARPGRDLPGEVVTFHEELLPILAEAGRVLRARTPEEDFEVRGFVIRVDRPEGQVGGTVTVSAPVEGKSHKILMGLSEAQCENAVRAHAQEAMISCMGELWRHGRSFTLESPRDFRVLGEQG